MVKTISLDRQSKPAKTYGYLRVSTIDQDINKNKSEILLLANTKRLGHVEFVEDAGVSGKVPWRNRKIASILEDCQKGDAIIVSELSRLGRSMLEVMCQVPVLVDS